jgi:hypothetical protein
VGQNSGINFSLIIDNFIDMTQSVVPVQKKGARSDTYYSIRAADENDAGDLFQNARMNLLNVNSWHALAGSGANFRLVNEKGEELCTLVEKGNYIRINLPGIPGTETGKGDEWVLVEKVEEGNMKYHEYAAIRVRPAVPPFADKPETAHFFSEDATSSFYVVRNNNKITVSVSGRNEIPNTDTSNPLTWIRNVIVGLGAMLGFNKPQWKKLVKGIARKKGAVLRV